MNSYLIWKTAHVISAAVLFGTGLGIAFFAWFGYRRALRSGSIEALRMVLQLTVLGDSIFTAPAVVFQILSGLVLLHLNHWSLASPWALTSIGIFVLVGCFWLPVVYLQLALSREAQTASSVTSLTPRFHRRFRFWFVLGVPAFLSVVWLFYLMISKITPFTAG